MNREQQFWEDDSAAELNELNGGVQGLERKRRARWLNSFSFSRKAMRNFGSA